jgi:predicted N-acetyltransferase YhbS
VKGHEHLMQIDLIPEMDLTAADDAAIAALLERAFSPAFGGKSFYKQRHHLRVVARDPDIVGHIALAFRTVRLGGQRWDVTGLAEVGTAPDRRGQGIAGALLQAAIAASRRSLASFVLLFGDERLYSAAGFRAVPNPVRHLAFTDHGMQDVQVLPDPSLMVLPLGAAVWDDGAEVDLMGHMF